MSKWAVEFLPEAAEDLKRLDGSVRRIVDKAISKVSMNPLSVEEGGYGKPLGNKDGTDLTGLMKVKLKASGHRIVYQVVREKSVMKIIIIGVREDSKVYKEADKRWKRIK